MTTVDFITALFYEIDEQLRTIPKHPAAHLWPSEVVTLGLLHALKPAFKGSKRTWGIFLRRVLYSGLHARVGGVGLRKKCQQWVVSRDVAGGCEHDGCNISVFTQTLLSAQQSQSRKIASSDAKFA
jgi:hypothetical protein